MADVVAVMRDGRVVQVAEPDELYSRPRDLGVATFVGEAVVLPAVVTDGVAETALGRLPVHANGTVGTVGRAGAGGARTGQVVLRPEQLELVGEAQGVPARVLGTSFYGHDALVQLEVGSAGSRPLTVSARVHGPHRVPRGQAVGLRVSGPGSFYADADPSGAPG